MRVIGLVGSKQHGKDTVCELIKKILSTKRVKRLAFADPLKTELADACGVSVDDINREKGRYRLGLQWWGTEFRRGQDKEYWIKQLDLCLAKADREGTDVAVVTDVRFLNEAALIKASGGQLVRVVRYGFTSGDGHSSETEMGLIEVDYVLHNSGTLDALEQEVRVYLSAGAASASTNLEF